MTNQLAVDIDRIARVHGDFVLRSGQRTDEYFDKYRFESDPVLLRRVAEAMLPLLPEGTELLGGLELGGVPIATVVGQLSGLPVLFVRKEAKTYGTCRLAEGAEVTGKRITLIEDVITTGGAVHDATQALRADGGLVDTVVCAIDRSEPGDNTLTEIGVHTRSILTKQDLDLARAARAPSSSRSERALQTIPE